MTTSACGLVASVRSGGDLATYQPPLPTGGHPDTLQTSEETELGPENVIGEVSTPSTRRVTAEQLT